MKKQGRLYLFILLSAGLLSGCLGTLWTGANMVYDRHDVYKKLNDYELSAIAQHRLFDDRVLKQPGCSLDLAVLNGDVLLAGHVPSEELREEATKRLNSLRGSRELFNQVGVSTEPNNGMEDSWITAKIRAQIFSDSFIDPNAFKIITADRIVYVMGDVRPKEAQRVLYMARTTSGVLRVVKLMRYYNLSDKPLENG